MGKRQNWQKWHTNHNLAYLWRGITKRKAQQKFLFILSSDNSVADWTNELALVIVHPSYDSIMKKI